MSPRSFVLLACVLLSAPEASGQRGWAERVLDTLSLRDKVAQLIIPAATATYRSEDDPGYRRLVRLVRDERVGGIIFFRGNLYDQALLTNRLQALAPLPLWIAQDMEWGLAMRLEGGTEFPKAMALGATRNPELAYRMGYAIAREARAIGVHQNFAPVVDVNNNPRNPIINVRSFGEDPRLVADLARAMIRGMQEGGLVATAKHFPGHGDTDVDSHLDLPIIRHSLTRLDSVELAPFRAAIESGVLAIMTAHIAFPALEPDARVPATLSAAVLDSLLRKGLGFQGLLVSDAMDMRGVTKHFGLKRASILALKAGVDLLLMPPDEAGVIDAIVEAVQRGELSEERIDRSVLRLLRLKELMGLHTNRFVDIEQISQRVGVQEHQELAREIARQALTLVKDDRAVLPLTRLNGERILLISLSDSDDPAVGRSFFAHLRARYPEVEHVRLDTRSTKRDYRDALSRAKKADYLVVASYVYIRSYSNRLGLPKEHVELLRRLARRYRQPTILIAFGNPYILREVPEVDACVITFSWGETTYAVTADALLGMAPIRGKLPITISPDFPYGLGIEWPQITLRYGTPEEAGFDAERLERLDGIIRRAIRERVFPGAALAVVRRGVLAYLKGFGALTYESETPVTPQTLFDLASLTKVVGTTSAVMKLYEEGRLRLDDPVSRYLPEFRGPSKERITIRQLLLHTGGLRAYKPFYQDSAFRKLSPSEQADFVWRFILEDTLQYEPGTRTLYSDFGFIVLGKLVERITAKSLDRYLEETFWRPLGMRRTVFRPLEHGFSPEEIAPTEQDRYWRNRLIHGTVHDETAAALGGVAGHAGLFSTARDLAVFAQMLLNGGWYGGQALLRPETIQLFRSRASEGSTRALGWDTRNTQGYSAAGKRMSVRAFGHTGFTGTSMWIDPDHELAVILLTNRVHPTRENPRIAEVRAAVADTVLEALRER
ncbi:MAG: glycoside hydrolase family 3 N-terminal domain-containing protein [Bacteroidota bacterium]|nr:serine hydrolase [Rhodothermia bacterium]MCS7154578.1 serine hydrolase [Bacteroidota bacterium]MDW8137371.1 glycoside hydrolase family 3 N-terminal domain-containing protein [Bacteroidota bacterium]MDW8285675.1 glycoside hydrolase family 3 N-terminal domain-containing protein [Bacteroidota bacterium]